MLSGLLLHRRPEMASNTLTLDIAMRWKWLYVFLYLIGLRWLGLWLCVNVKESP